MTCIVGIQHGQRVWIAGDSAGVGGYSLSLRADAKVFRNGPYVMGFTSSFRMGQLLRYAFAAPRPTTDDLDRFMATTFIDGVRECLKTGGFAEKTNNVEEGGSFLVGVRGTLYAVHSDFQIARTLDGYDAVGCGSDLALGSLHSTRDRQSPKRRAIAALEAAAHHSAGVAAPFTVEISR